MMVEVLNVEDYSLDLDALELALSEYQKFRGSEEYKESYKWEILQEFQQWFSEQEINKETVLEFIEKLKEENPNSGPLVHWSNIDDLKKFAEQDPEKASEILNRLYNKDIDLKDRINDFRDSLEIGTPMFGYLLSAYDPDKYAPIKVENFRSFLDYFSVKRGSEVTKLSLGEKYRLYIAFCEKLAKFISDNTDLEATALNAQDFMYCLTSDYSMGYNYMLKYLYRFAQKMEVFSKNTDDLLNEIRAMPSNFLKREMEYYEGKEKINKIRHEVISQIIQDAELDLDEIKNDVKIQYDKDILRSWNDFTILGQIYLKLYKEIYQTYLEKISNTLINRIDGENLKSHIVNFQGSQNFPKDMSWLALFPTSKENHQWAYQFFLGIKSDRIEYGLKTGSKIDTSEKENTEEIKDINEIEINSIIDKFIEVKDQFYSLNELVEEDNLELDEKNCSYFILVTGGGEYEDRPEKVYPFKKGIPGSKQLREAENVKFVYYEDGQFYATGEIDEIISEEKEDATYFKGKVSNYSEFEESVSLDVIEDKISVSFPTGQGIVNIPKEDYETIRKGRRNYFWVTANPKIWEVSEIKDGGEIFYAAYNEKGNKRRIFDAFKSAKAGDKVIFYESTPVKEIVAEGTVTKGLHLEEEEGFDEPVKGISIEYNEKVESITWEDVKDIPDLEESDPIKNQAQGSLFELTNDEYETILAIEETEKTPVEKDIEEILNDVFLKEEDTEKVREYFVMLFNYLGDPNNLKPKIDTTYNVGRKKISVNFAHWQIFSIERKGNNYHAQFVVDVSELPQDFAEWPELVKEYDEFNRGKGIKLIRTRWNDDLFQKYPELKRAWKNSIEKAKSEFKDWSKSPYHRHHREVIYNWIMEKFSKKEKSRIEKNELLEINNSRLEFENLDFTEGLFFPEEMEKDINQSVNSALKSGKNIIFTGPPGTGKTKIAKNVAEKVIEKCDCVDDFVFTTATADWTTFDTIGGYHPQKEDGSLSFEPGQFLKCFKEEKELPVNKWLIIDEINRADIDKAFGQLFSVLSNDNVELPFTDEEERKISINSINSELDENELDYSDSDYYVTRNWRLLATMNTFDKASLYEMSYAFMRRFAFIDVGVPTSKISVDLIDDYISVWSEMEENDFSGELKEDLASIWRTLNEGKRSIGPAIIRDMLLFLREQDSSEILVNALKLYVLPQLEGMVKVDQKQIFNSLMKIERINEEDLKRVAKERFEIEKLGEESE